MTSSIEEHLVDFSTRFADAPEEYLRKGLALHDHYHDHALIRTAFAPHATYSVIVYAAGRDQVRQVWVVGRHLIRDGEPTTLDPAAILDEAREWGARIAAAN